MESETFMNVSTCYESEKYVTGPSPVTLQSEKRPHFFNRI